MDFYRASNSPSWERLWEALYVDDDLATAASEPRPRGTAPSPIWCDRNAEILTLEGVDRGSQTPSRIDQLLPS
jgi:hypothetical protein